MPWLSRAEQLTDARAVARAASCKEVPLVVAIIRTESGGRAHACAEDARGGASRGLMQVRRPRSRCVGRDPLFSPSRNVLEGVRVLRAWQTFERLHHRAAHDPLLHYSGGQSGYAATVRERAARLGAVFGRCIDR